MFISGGLNALGCSGSFVGGIQISAGFLMGCFGDLEIFGGPHRVLEDYSRGMYGNTLDLYFLCSSALLWWFKVYIRGGWFQL